MRRDPVEVEHFARLELANASRRVKRELESTILEFAYFRRATQQAIKDALDEVKETLTGAKDHFVGQLDEFATRSSKPIEEASERSGVAIEDVSTRMTESLDAIAMRLTEDASQLSKSAAATVRALDAVVSKLSAMQTPEQII